MVKEVRREDTVLTCKQDQRDKPCKITCPVSLSIGERSHRVDLQVDSGASCSVLSLDVARAMFKGCKYDPTTTNLFGFGKVPLKVVGSLPVQVQYGDVATELSFYLVDTKASERVMGLDLMKAFGLTIQGHQGLMLQPTVCSVDRVSQEEELPAIRGYKHRIVLQSEAVPTAYRLRRLPLSVRDEVSDELQRLLRAGVIERIEASPWVSPMVVARKPNGKIRLCVDLRGPNAQIVPEVHPLPTIDELQTRLQGSVYSKLDLSSAYHQLELNPDSRNITAFITHDGLMRFKRVPFGLVSAGSACQKLLDDLLHDIPGCGHYMDDILVSGESFCSHQMTTA